MSTLKAPLSIRLADQDPDRVIRDLQQKIRELQALPLTSARVIQVVTLADSALTPVRHGLGRIPIWVRESTVRGATSSGRIVETRDGTLDRTQFVALTATGWGATITIDLLVM